MRNLRTVILATFIFMVPASGVCQVAGSAVAEQQDYAFAVGLYRDAQYALAFQQFTTFLKNYPRSQQIVEVTFLAGECLLQERMYDSALSYYQTVMEKYPGSKFFMRSELRSGEIYLQLEKLDKSERLLKDVLANSEGSDLKSEAAYKLGQLFIARNDYSNAIKYFDLTYEGYPQSSFADYAMYGSGWCYGKTTDFARSREVFESLLTKYPETKLKADATEKIGECDFFTRNYNGAVVEFADAVGLTSDSQVQEPGLYYQGRAYIALNSGDSARAIFSEYLRKFPDGEHAKEVKVLYSTLLVDAKSDIPEALTLLGDIQPGDPLYFRSRIQVARAYQASGSSDSAEATLLLLAKSSEDENETAEAYFELGKFYFQDKSYKKSQEAYLLASKDQNLYARSMKDAAVSAAAANDYANAKLFFLNAISRLKGTESLNAHFDYAAALYAGGDYQGAAQIYTTAADLAGSDSLKSQAIYMAAESFYRAGNYQRSLADYKIYINDYPSGPHSETALLGIGYSQYFSSDFTDAAATFRNFIGRYPSSPLLSDAYMRMGDCYYYGRDYQHALSVYQNAAGLFAADTSSAYAWYQIGQVDFQLRQFTQALSSFQVVVSKYSQTSVAPEALYAIGWVYFSEKDYSDAITNFSRVSDNYPGSPIAARALYSKGDSYYNSGNYESALVSYRQLLEKYPTSIYVDNAIVGMQYCLTVMGKTQEAEGVIDNFVRDHPDLPDVDRIYYKKVEYALNQKNYPDAERYLREFIVKFPKSQIVSKALYNLGLVEIQMGKTGTGMGFFSDLIAKNPRTEYTTAAQVKLAEIYSARKNFAEAERLLSQAASAQDVFSTRAQVDLGNLYLRRGDTLQAESNFSKAALSQSDSVNDADRADAKVLLSKIYFDKGRVSDAISLANSVAKTRDDMIGADAQLHVAEYYCSSGDSSNAVLAFLRVKYVFSSFSDIVAESQLRLAECLTKFGNISDARSLLRQFIKGRPADSYTRRAQEELKKLKSN